MTTVALSGLRVGIRLHSAIYDASPDSDLMLLAGGTTITRSLLDRLEQRGITSVRVSKDEVARIVTIGPTAGAISRRMNDYDRDQELKQKYEQAKKQSEIRNTENQVRADSFVHQLLRPSAEPFSNFDLERITKQHARQGKRVDSLYSQFETGDVSGVAEVSEVTSEALLSISEDLDLLLATGLQPEQDQNYPSRHALQTATLAISIGTIHGLKESELIELGIGCLLHDVGMMHLSVPVHKDPELLDQVSALEITKHPIRSLDLLQKASKIPSTSGIVAYQMHERFDGSGYPRGRGGSQIHLYARIAAVADTYISLISPRASRLGQLPYHAVEQILYDTRAKKFDPNVVRSFLHTISLFPVGSYVELTDGRKARILRSNRENYTNPLVEVVDHDSIQPFPEMIDLSLNQEIQIARPIQESTQLIEPELLLV